MTLTADISRPRRRVAMLALLALPILPWSGFIAPAAAQDSGNRAKDIETKLKSIFSKPPLERAVAVDAALHSDDPLLRSFVLEKAFQDQDSRVKEIAFFYLLRVQKQFLVNVVIPSSTLEDMQNAAFKGLLVRMAVLTVTITSFDNKTGRFAGYVNMAYQAPIMGTVAQNGLTISFPTPVTSSKGQTFVLNFRNAASGHLIGSLDFGPYSFAARTALQ